MTPEQLEFAEYKDQGIWVSNDAGYRIKRYDQIEGVNLPVHFHAMVVCWKDASKPTDGVFWHFAGPRRHFRTLEAAIKACKKHKRAWQQVLSAQQKLKGRKLKARMKTLAEKHTVGSGQKLNRLLAYTPTWIHTAG